MIRYLSLLGILVFAGVSESYGAGKKMGNYDTLLQIDEMKSDNTDKSYRTYKVEFPKLVEGESFYQGSYILTKKQGNITDAGHLVFPLKTKELGNNLVAFFEMKGKLNINFEVEVCWGNRCNYKASKVFKKTDAEKILR